MSKDNNRFFAKKNEWSEVKDELLGCYLRPYIQKILATHKPLFYVDCFAGKGRFNDGKSGSPLIALDIIDKCLTSTSLEQVTIESCFIELNHAEELSSNIIGHENTNIISGRYEDYIQNLLKEKRNQNVFLYIDPYGIKALDSDLFDSFLDYGLNSIEILLNMNSFGFIREACHSLNVIYDDVESFDQIVEYDPSVMDSSAQSIQSLNRIAGGNYWIQIIKDYKAHLIDGYEAEMKFSIQYCHRLNEKYKYVLNMPIRLKEHQRPKYRLIHATNHADGCILMYDNICNRWQVLNNIQTGGQISIFEETIENQAVNLEDIQKKVEQHLLRYERYTSLNKILAEFYTIYGVLCRSTKIRDILQEMEDSKYIEVARLPAETKAGKPTRFFTENSKQHVQVRGKS